MASPVRLFVSCSTKAEDRALREQFEKHLAPLVRGGTIALWHEAPLGAKPREWVQQRIGEADVILLLISPDYLDSEELHEEKSWAQEQRAKRRVLVTPLLLRPCLWPEQDDFQVLPRNEIPIASWSRPEEAFAEIARELDDVVRKLAAVPASPARTASNNPFAIGLPIADPRHFFGQRDHIKRIFGLWANHPGQLQNVAIIGRRRSGKTSLLHHLRHLATLPPDALRPDQREQCPAAVRAFRWVFVDFQDPRMRDPAFLLRHLLAGFGLPAPEPCTMESFYQSVVTGLSTQAIVLLDEVGVALGNYRALDYGFWQSLRALAQAVEGKLGFVLAAPESPKTIAEREGNGSPFFNIFGLKRELGPLNEVDARQLIGSSPMPFSEDDVGWILATSQRRPLLLDLLCRERLVALQDGEQGDGWRAEALRQMEPFKALLEEP